MGIPIALAKDLSDLYSNIDSDTKHSFIDLFMKIGNNRVAETVALPPKNDVSISKLLVGNKSEMDILKEEVLDFYKAMDPEMYEVAMAILTGKNPNFGIVFFDPNDERFSNLKKISPCITTTDEANLPYQVEQQNIVCVPIEGYGTETQHISMDDIFILAHELAHAMGYTFSSNVPYLGKIDSNPKAVSGVVFGETDSKVIEVQVGKFLLEKYPDVDESVRSEIKRHLIKSFIKDSVLEARESFIKLGIGSGEYQNSEGDLGDDELDVVCSSMGVGKDFLERQVDNMSKRGSFSGRDHLKYLMGDLIAVSMSPRSYVEVAQALKGYWKGCKGETSIGDKLAAFGIGEPIVNNLYNGYEAYAMSWRSAEVNKVSGSIAIRKNDIKGMANNPKVSLEKVYAQQVVGEAIATRGIEIQEEKK